MPHTCLCSHGRSSERLARFPRMLRRADSPGTREATSSVLRNRRRSAARFRTPRQGGRRDRADGCFSSGIRPLRRRYSSAPRTRNRSGRNRRRNSDSGWSCKADAVNQCPDAPIDDLLAGLLVMLLRIHHLGEREQLIITCCGSDSPAVWLSATSRLSATMRSMNLILRGSSVSAP